MKARNLALVALLFGGVALLTSGACSQQAGIPGPPGPTGPRGPAGSSDYLGFYALDLTTAVTLTTVSGNIMTANVAVQANTYLHVDAYVSGDCNNVGGSTAYTQIRIVRAGTNAVRAKAAQTVTPVGGTGMASMALHWVELCPLAETVQVVLEGSMSAGTCNIDPMAGGGAFLKGIKVLN